MVSGDGHNVLFLEVFAKIAYTRDAKFPTLPQGRVKSTSGDIITSRGAVGACHHFVVFSSNKLRGISVFSVS